MASEPESSVARTCARGPAGEVLALSCSHPNATIHRIDFAYFGQLGGECGALTRGPCAVSIGHVVGARCLGRSSCRVAVRSFSLTCLGDVSNPHAAISVICAGWSDCNPSKPS